ncbi:hypothetical protein [Aquimarina rubra]|uniref:DUF4340 domain-containing protein n=1 Tax=Aquimarina rubra TaxID=1920033 RepID=A0ABW5LDQ3_9FLAO
MKLKTFESKIGKRIIVAGFVITLLSFLITILTLKLWNKESKEIEADNPTDTKISVSDKEREIKNTNLIKLANFENGIWFNEEDTLSGIEISNQKWIMSIIGTKTDSADIYDFEITRSYLKEIRTMSQPIELLRLTNKTDTLDYLILNYDQKKFSLSHIPSGKTYVYIKK